MSERDPLRLQALPLELADGALLRVAREDDAAACLAIYAPIVEGTHTSFETEVPQLEDFRARIRDTLQTHDWLVVERAGSIEGYAYSTAHRARAAYRIACEVSVYMAENAQRRGFARLLYEQVLARAAAAGKRQAYAIITLPNEPSIAFHRALGFEPLAHFPEAGVKFGRYWDVDWWVRRLA